MTKTEIIKELHDIGELWANASYTKEYLKKSLDEINDARNMSDDELLKKIMMMGGC